jgi:hypothetical protein
MFDALNFAQIDAQHVELLPARIVLSLLSGHAPKGGDAGNGGQGGTGGTGGAGSGKAELFHNFFYVEGDVTNSLSSGDGGASSADGGATSGGTGASGTGQ